MARGGSQPQGSIFSCLTESSLICPYFLIRSEDFDRACNRRNNQANVPCDRMLMGKIPKKPADCLFRHVPLAPIGTSSPFRSHEHAGYGLGGGAVADGGNG